MRFWDGAEILDILRYRFALETRLWFSMISYRKRLLNRDNFTPQRANMNPQKKIEINLRWLGIATMDLLRRELGSCRAEDRTIMFTVRTASVLVAVAIVLAAFAEARQGQDAQNQVIQNAGTKAAANAAPAHAPNALATALKPTKPPEYYIEQAHLYWNNMDTRFDQRTKPNYSPLVTRWEWPPWLYLAGTGRDVMIGSTSLFMAPQIGCATRNQRNRATLR